MVHWTLGFLRSVCVGELWQSPSHRAWLPWWDFCPALREKQGTGAIRRIQCRLRLRKQTNGMSFVLGWTSQCLVAVTYTAILLVVTRESWEFRPRFSSTMVRQIPFIGLENKPRNWISNFAVPFPPLKLICGSSIHLSSSPRCKLQFTPTPLY